MVAVSAYAGDNAASGQSVNYGTLPPVDMVDTTVIPTQVADAGTQVAQAGGNPPGTFGVMNNKIKITFGGFIEAAGIYRNHTESGDINSNFNTGIPFPNSPNDHIDEIRGTARQSRLSILAQGDVDADTHLAAYYEMDFLGAAPTANSNESNSFNLRIRNIYATIDQVSTGWHVLVGQNWSLATLNRTGILPRTEVTPVGPEAQYVEGFNWTRTPQFRVVKDFNQQVWVGVSVENPQTLVTNGPNAFQASNVITGVAGSGGLGNGTPAGNFSIDPAPDVVGKIALDPGWGHYEVLGVARWFRSRAAFQNTTITGEGVGANALLPLVPKMLDLTLTGLIGKGLGRYGSAQLPDVTTDMNGILHALPFRSMMLGLIGHPDPTLDVYGYAGTEQVKKEIFTGTNGLGYGYGDPLYSNAGCLTESTGTCTANTSRMYEVTGGFWYKFYQGSFGYFEFGVQDEYLKRHIFAGVGGAPVASSNMVIASFRYYPF